MTTNNILSPALVNLIRQQKQLSDAEQRPAPLPVDQFTSPNHDMFKTTATTPANSSYEPWRSQRVEEITEPQPSRFKGRPLDGKEFDPEAARFHNPDALRVEGPLPETERTTGLVKKAAERVRAQKPRPLSSFPVADKYEKNMASLPTTTLSNVKNLQNTYKTLPDTTHLGVDWVAQAEGRYKAPAMTERTSLAIKNAVTSMLKLTRGMGGRSAEQGLLHTVSSMSVIQSK